LPCAVIAAEAKAATHEWVRLQLRSANAFQCAMNKLMEAAPSLVARKDKHLKLKGKKTA